MTNADRFWLAYRRHLAAAVDRSPERYVGLVRKYGNPKAFDDPDDVARRWVDEIRQLDIGAIDTSTRPFALACRELRINHSEAAIRRYLEGDNGTVQS